MNCSQVEVIARNFLGNILSWCHLFSTNVRIELKRNKNISSNFQCLVSLLVSSSCKAHAPSQRSTLVERKTWKVFLPIISNARQKKFIDNLLEFSFSTTKPVLFWLNLMLRSFQTPVKVQCQGCGCWMWCENEIARTHTRMALGSWYIDLCLFKCHNKDVSLYCRSHVPRPLLLHQIYTST